jgi:hypothetical protein
MSRLVGGSQELGSYYPRSHLKTDILVGLRIQDLQKFLDTLFD